MKRGKLFFRYEILGAEGFNLIERLYAQKIAVFDVEFHENKIIISIDASDSKKLFAISRNMCYNIRRIKYYGKVSPVKFLQKKIGIVLCFALTLFLLVAFDGFVTKIEYLSDAKTLAPIIDGVLKTNGVKENSFLTADLKSLEKAVYLSSDKISFVSIEKKGRILSVEARLGVQKTEPIDLKKEKIISTVSGEVTAINSYSGTAKVKVGDKVKKGDILIDGYYDWNDQIIKTYALGEVEIKAEFKFDYKSFASGEKYKNRAVFLAKQSLKSQEIVQTKVEQKKENGKIIYSVTLYYLVVVG
ncbi:MAG: sporulation protein YqfD [Clostridia bacterium]|nr:sporulation protein YqfD [Clostridia bacterium]